MSNIYSFFSNHDNMFCIEDFTYYFCMGFDSVVHKLNVSILTLTRMKKDGIHLICILNILIPTCLL